MGTALVKLINRKQTEFTVLPAEKRRKTVLKVPFVNPPEYRFDEFVLKCENLQRIKKLLETKIRSELKQWSLKSSRQDASSSEHKRCIFQLLSYFKTIQEEQNDLIQREKLRFEMIKAEFGEANIRKMRNRLKYFIELNKEHEEIISRIRGATYGTENYKIIHTCKVGGSSDGRKKSRSRVNSGNKC